MTAPALELLVREGCHLCDEFLLELSLDQPACMADLTLRDVDGEAELAAEFGLRVPVLRREDHVVCEGRYDRSKVAAGLQV
jgi:uncharacterized protein with PhoU and TrkA domain